MEIPSSLDRLVPVVQGAIAPTILISGVGLLLLSMTNRFGRVLDRSRELARERRQVEDGEREGLERQIAILYRRSRLLQAAVTLAGLSVFLSALLVTALFFGALLALDFGALAMGLFIANMVVLVFSMVFFLRDVFLSLHALDLELGFRR